MTLQDVLNRLRTFIGDCTQKSAARKLNVSQQYLTDVLNGNREPGPLILVGLGIERVVTYRDAGTAPGLTACANCLRPQREHNGELCPRPYTTHWHAWDYGSAQPTYPEYPQGGTLG